MTFLSSHNFICVIFAARSKVNYDPFLNIRGQVDGLVYGRLLQGPMTLAQVVDRMPKRMLQIEIKDSVIDSREDSEPFLEIIKIAQVGPNLANLRLNITFKIVFHLEIC